MNLAFSDSKQIHNIMRHNILGVHFENLLTVRVPDFNILNLNQI